MNTYFKRLITDLTDVHAKGVDLSINGSSVIYKARLDLTMDLQARAYVLNMTQHNGESACIFCEQAGKVVKKGKGNCRIYPFEETAPQERTDKSILQASIAATETIKRLKGMHGRTVFMCLAYLSLVSSIVVDYMHGTSNL